MTKESRVNGYAYGIGYTYIPCVARFFSQLRPGYIRALFLVCWWLFNLWITPVILACFLYDWRSGLEIVIEMRNDLNICFEEGPLSQ